MRQCPLLAPSGHRRSAGGCPLMSAFDPSGHQPII